MKLIVIYIFAHVILTLHVIGIDQNLIHQQDAYMSPSNAYLQKISAGDKVRVLPNSASRVISRLATGCQEAEVVEMADMDGNMMIQVKDGSEYGGRRKVSSSNVVPISVSQSTEGLDELYGRGGISNSDAAKKMMRLRRESDSAQKLSTKEIQNLNGLLNTKSSDLLNLTKKYWNGRPKNKEGFSNIRGQLLMNKFCHSRKKLKNLKSHTATTSKNWKR
jgi:hypothetical protein